MVLDKHIFIIYKHICFISGSLTQFKSPKLCHSLQKHEKRILYPSPMFLQEVCTSCEYIHYPRHSQMWEKSYDPKNS